jgi:prepilin-type N-terminal cleavage/methylation domain-containing protein
MSRRAFSIIEVLVALSLTTVLLTGVYQLQLGGERAFERISREVQIQTRYATLQEKLVRELRRAIDFSTPGHAPGPMLSYRVATERTTETREIRFQPGGLISRVEGGETFPLGRDSSLQELEFEPEYPTAQATTSRLLKIRIAVAWLDAAGRSGSLTLYSRVFARGAPLAALKVFQEDVQ